VRWPALIVRGVGSNWLGAEEAHLMCATLHRGRLFVVDDVAAARLRARPRCRLGHPRARESRELRDRSASDEDAIA
jgi:hypothetical protein